MLIERKKRKNYATVLSLHRVSDEYDFFWPPVKTGTFRKLLEYCARKYQVIHLSELAMPSGGKPRLVLSFDDGYSDFIENALPELMRVGIPSNHNVVIECVEKNSAIWTQDLGGIFSYLRKINFKGTLSVGDESLFFDGVSTPWMRQYLKAYHILLKKKKEARASIIHEWKVSLKIPEIHVSMMNWEDVRKCSRSGVEIGSHTVSHQTLTTLDEDSLLFEVRSSKRMLETTLGIQCETFAVPNGQSDARVLKVISESGYKRVLMANDAFFKQNNRIGDTLLEIGRINVSEAPFNEVRMRIGGFHHVVKNGSL
jgi:peptidoglycan/xylan/chitin deacetylase (PgdA/CDA1 family)